MKPILFGKTATQFNTNGMGRLDAISCKVIEERNGIFELEMEIAETALHASEIESESIIVAKPNQKDSQQAFRVYKITKPINGRFSVFARHITYQLSYITAMPFTVSMSSSACANTLAGLKSNAVGACPFNFSTDVATASSYKQTAPASIKSRLGGAQGSVLDQFGGEYKWDNWNVYLLNHRGITTPQVTLRYGKNIIDFSQEENIENTVTGIVPYWVSTDRTTIVTLTEKVVEISTASSFPYKKTIPYDFSTDFTEQPTEAQLKARAQAYLATSGVGVPKVSIKLSFVNLSDTEEYKDIAAFQAVGLCDNVNVQFEKLGISTTAEIVKYDYDVLREKYNSVEIGSLRSTLMTTISGAMKDIEGVGELVFDSSGSVLSEAKGYADGVASSAESSAKDYADGKASSAESAAKNFATNAASAAQSAAEEYARREAASAVSSANNYTNTKLQSYPTNNDLTLALDTATGWLTSSDGKVMARKDANGDWKELFFLSATATENSGNVLRINENGIGFGRNGWGGSFTQAWTLDGKLVIGGTNVPELTVYTSDNTQTRQILFKVSRDGITWNLANSSMSQNGTLTIKNAFIDGGTLAVVDPNWTPAQQGDTPTDADYLFRVNALGLLWNLTNSTMATDGTLLLKEANISGKIKTAWTDPNLQTPINDYMTLQYKDINFFRANENSCGAKIYASNAFSFGPEQNLNIEAGNNIHIEADGKIVIEDSSRDENIIINNYGDEKGIELYSDDYFFKLWSDGDFGLKCNNLFVYEDTTDELHPGLDEIININGDDFVFSRGILIYHGAPADNPFRIIQS
jgi:phage minor structural protein